MSTNLEKAKEELNIAKRSGMTDTPCNKAMVYVLLSIAESLEKLVEKKP